MYIDDIQKEYDTINRNITKIMNDEVVAIFEKFMASIIYNDSDKTVGKKKLIELYTIFTKDIVNNPLNYKYEIRNMFEYNLETHKYSIKPNFTIFSSVLALFLRVLDFDVEEIRSEFIKDLDRKEAFENRDLEEIKNRKDN